MPEGKRGGNAGEGKRRREMEEEGEGQRRVDKPDSLHSPLSLVAREATSRFLSMTGLWSVGGSEGTISKRGYRIQEGTRG